MSYRYLYGTNRLQKVIKNGIDTVHYSCDSLGNISGGYGELGKYNYQNLPLEMLNADSELYNYSYNSNGKRISKTSSGSGEYYLNDYLGRELAIYDIVTGELKEVNILGNGLAGKIMIDDSDATGYYYSKDHLGSVRVVMSDNGSITSAQDYYPYGELLREYNSASQRYQFTGKEKDGESSYLHFDARTLDPSLPMWLQVDPMSGKYPGWSPYNYTLCNPLRYIDPKGMMTYKVNGIEYDYDVWYGLAEPFIQDAEKKEKEKKAEEEKKKEKEKSKNSSNGVSGNNILFKTYAHFQIGGGNPLIIDASTLDFSNFSQSDLVYLGNGKYGLNLYAKDPKSQMALSLGKITLIYQGDNKYTIAPDYYDFNIEWQNGLSKRNIATAGAGILHYGINPIMNPLQPLLPIIFGGPYWIKFQGNIQIKP